MDFNIEPKSKVKTLLAAAGFCLVVVIVAFAYLFGFAPFPEKSLPDRIIGSVLIAVSVLAFFSLTKAGSDGRILYLISTATSGLLALLLSPITFAFKKFFGNQFLAPPFSALCLQLGRPFMFLFDGFLAVAATVTRNPVVHGDLEEIWLQNGIDAEVRPELHNTEIPADMRRPLWRDGRTVLRESIATLFDHRVDRETIAARIGVGLLMGLITFAILWSLQWRFGYVPSSALNSPEQRLPDQFYTTPTLPGMVSEILVNGVSAQVYEAWFVVSDFLTNALSGPMFAFSLLSISMGAISTALAWRAFYSVNRAQYGLETRDVSVSSLRAGKMEIIDSAYRGAIDLALGYERGAPLMSMGRATGLMRSRGDITAPMRGQEFVIDFPSLFLNTIVFGGTGSGKSTYALARIAKFALGEGASGFILDDKAVLYKEVKVWMDAIGRGDDVRIIGPEDDMFHVDLLDELEPAEVMLLIDAIIKQTGAGVTSGDTFWQTSAISLMRATLFVAKAFECFPEGQDYMRQHAVRIYSLGWVYRAITQRDSLAGAVDKILRAYAEEDRELLDRFDSDSEQMRSSLKYIVEEFLLVGRDNKMVESIKKTAESYMSSLCDEPDMRRFAWAAKGNCISIKEALNGKIICLALNQLRYGAGAKLAAMLIKASYYRAARLREGEIGSKACQAKPSLCLMDEAQGLLALGGTGIDDQSFFNVNRSTGVMGVLATQSLSSLLSGGGGGANTADHIGNLLNNCRNKLFLAVEDEKTLEMAQKLAGKQPRSEYGPGAASVEERILEHGFMPIWPQEIPMNLITPVSPSIELSQVRTLFSMSTKNHAFSKAPLINSRDATFTSGFGVTYGQYANIMGIDPVMHSGDVEDFIQINSPQLVDPTGRYKARKLDADYGRDITNADILSPNDIEQMGRGFSMIFTQRAGLMRFDMVRIEHDFTK